jgi:hypothetical protein
MQKRSPLAPATIHEKVANRNVLKRIVDARDQSLLRDGYIDSSSDESPSRILSRALSEMSVSSSARSLSPPARMDERPERQPSKTYIELSD